MSDSTETEGKRTGRGSIFDVARASGVSIGTVSRAFNNKPDVAEATRLHVLEAAKRVNYKPKSCARRMSIGLLVEQLNEANEVGFVGSMISSVAKQIAEQGGVLELVSFDDLDAVYRKHLAGLIALVFKNDCKVFREFDNIPVVLVNNLVEGVDVHSVGSDHAQGAYIATRHLLGMGHRRIAFMEIMENGWGSRERQRGYRRALQESGVVYEPELVRFCLHTPVHNELEAALEREPTGLLVCGEDLSLSVNRLLVQKFRIEIPEKLSVISYDIPLVTELLGTPQTAVSQPWADISRAAIETVCAQLGRQTQERTIRLFPNRLINRDSVRCLNV
jgi:LacI family transcriptional regulator